MIDIIQFKPEHAEYLKVQAAQKHDATRPIAETAAAGVAFTAVRRADYRVLGIAGLAIHHSGWATAWASLALGKGADFVAMQRAMARVLDEAGRDYRRVDMMVRADFAAAHRLAMLMGFVPEGSKRAATLDGVDIIVYARVREVRKCRKR